MQMLVTAAHIDVIETEVLPALRAGKNVVLDRYWWSTLVYGRKAGASRKLLEQLVDLEQQAWANVSPASLFLVNRRSALDSPDAVALSRRYTRLAKAEAGHGRPPIVSIRNEGPKAAAVREVLERLQPIIARVNRDRRRRHSC